jgi:hypothetical protein
MLTLGLVVLSACGNRSSTEESDGGNRDLEVVVFNTPIPATPTSPSTATTQTEAGATPTSSIAVTPTITPTAALSRAENENPLTGLIVDDPIVFDHRPLHVRIGNDPQARPQVNLSQADIVYEEIVEWWITRLTAI